MKHKPVSFRHFRFGQFQIQVLHSRNIHIPDAFRLQRILPVQILCQYIKCKNTVIFHRLAECGFLKITVRIHFYGQFRILTGHQRNF